MQILHTITKAATDSAISSLVTKEDEELSAIALQGFKSVDELFTKLQTKIDAAKSSPDESAELLVGLAGLALVGAAYIEYKKSNAIKN